MSPMRFAFSFVLTSAAASLAACSATPTDTPQSAASSEVLARKKLRVPGSKDNMAVAPLIVEDSAGGASDAQHYLVEEVSNEEMVVLDVVNPKPGKQPEATMNVANVHPGQGQAFSTDGDQPKDRTSVVLWPDNYNIDVKSVGPATTFHLEVRRVTPASFGWPKSPQTKSVLAKGTVKKKGERHYYLSTETKLQWLISEGAHTTFRAFDESGLLYDSKDGGGFTWKQQSDFDMLVLEVTADKDGAAFELQAKESTTPSK